MILQSRKWRLLIRVVVLVLASALMLPFAAPASYALQDDSPKQITRAAQLYDKEKPVEDAYVYTWALPDLGRVVTTHTINATYHWIPLPGYDNLLFVRVEGDTFLRAYFRSMDVNLATEVREANFYGKVTSLKSQAGTEEVIKALAASGINVDKDRAMVLLQGEEPSTYR